MTRVEITTSELLDALAVARSNAGPADARTVGEMSAQTHVSERRVRAILMALQREGRVTVHRVRRIALDGRSCWVPGYVIAPKSRRR